MYLESLEHTFENIGLIFKNRIKHILRRIIWVFLFSFRAILFFVCCRQRSSMAWPKSDLSLHCWHRNWTWIRGQVFFRWFFLVFFVTHGFPGIFSRVFLLFFVNHGCGSKSEQCIHCHRKLGHWRVGIVNINCFFALASIIIDNWSFCFWKCLEI